MQILRRQLICKIRRTAISYPSVFCTARSFKICLKSEEPPKNLNTSSGLNGPRAIQYLSYQQEPDTSRETVPLKVHIFNQRSYMHARILRAQDYSHWADLVFSSFTFS